MPSPVLLEEFAKILRARYGTTLDDVSAVALGLSGGPDSMALLALLSDWAVAQGRDVETHALIVDHGLRPESAEEAAQVAEAAGALANVKVEILCWTDDKPETGVQDSARKARYMLMAEYCQTHGIEHLFLGHHQDDQAETFLFRLAKGSGLDGLAAMSARQILAGTAVAVLRPLLDISKDRLVETCGARGLVCVHDPSNEKEQFARVRLRKSMDVLEQEGLSAKRLAVTAMRLGRAREALEKISANIFEQALLKKNTKQIVLDFCVLQKQSEEIALRVVLQGFSMLRPEADYAPRMERVEALVADLMAAAPFRRRTLGGLVIERNDREGQLKIQIEESAR